MNVSALAQEMNVTTTDVESLLRMVCNSIEQDKMGEQLLEMNEADRVEFVSAYVHAEVKKFSEFCATLLTNQEKKSAFDQYLFAQFKD